MRAEGFKGPKFLVMCTLRNKDKGRSVRWKLAGVVKKYTNDKGETKEVNIDFKPETMTETLPPDREYRINYLKRLDDAQVEYIKSHYVAIENEILVSGKILPEYFGLHKQKKVKAKQ